MRLPIEIDASLNREANIKAATTGISKTQAVRWFFRQWVDGKLVVPAGGVGMEDTDGKGNAQTRPARK